MLNRAIRLALAVAMLSVCRSGVANTWPGPPSSDTRWRLVPVNGVEGTAEEEEEEEERPLAAAALDRPKADPGRLRALPGGSG